MADDRFEADWLALREPVDHRSRDEDGARMAGEEARRRGWTRAVDLGSGSGSNLRYLAPFLPGIRSWGAVDHDAGLLDRIVPPGGIDLERIHGDLAREGLEAIRGADLVTGSALLDLVSEVWLRSLVSRCAEDSAAALFALSYDGSVRWLPEEPGDRVVLGLVNRHQRRDKGLGGALGPEAATVARGLFEAAGYTVRLVRTPWQLAGAEDAALALRLLDGWAEAAREEDPDAAAGIQAWRERRSSGIRGWGRGGAPESVLEVGHLDLLALPPAGPPR